MSEASGEAIRVLVLARMPFSLDSLGPADQGLEARLIRRPKGLEAALDEIQPHVVLVDTALPDGKGIDAVAETLLLTPPGPSHRTDT